MRSAARGAAGLVVAGATLAACSGIGGSEDKVQVTLAAFNECDELRDYFVEHALDVVGPYGLDGGLDGVEEEGLTVDEDMEMEDAPAAAEQGARDGGAEDSAPVEGEDFSGTNNQEAGVDEADHVKTDGERLLAIDGDRLHVVDLTGSAPSHAGTVDLPETGTQAHEILLDGDSALVLSSSTGWTEPEDHDGVAAITSTLTLVDLSSAPTATETLTLDGTYLSARLVDGMARVVVRTEPVGLDFTTPDGGGVRAEREALEHNQEVIRASEVGDWLPDAVYEGPGGDPLPWGTDVGGGAESLVDCADVYHPEEFSGFGLAAVLTLEPDAGLTLQGSNAVVGAGETVYASPDNLYVASQRWAFGPGREDARDHDEVTTQLHQFSLEDSAAPYAASGEVPGRLLNQWALSEYDGHLRVATTEGEPWGPEEGPEASQSTVRVLRENGQELEEVGAVTGLGEGERIYAVRYSGDIGYVVTFRETDPLYTVDLSDPADPQVRGELKILGYSSYLHPIGEDLLLGVGQDADETGQPQGTQVSVFDVSDLADPVRTHQETIPGGYSAVEHDHRALLHWPAAELTVIPVESGAETWIDEEEPDEEIWINGEEPTEAFTGAIAYEAGVDGITEVGRVDHSASGEDWAVITRSLVADEVLYTVSDAGVLASDLASFEEIEWVAF